MKKKILLIVATHGDEKIGLEVIERLKNKKFDKYFDFLIGNPKALAKNLRFVEADLNRSYPGIKDSPCYEKRIAFENLLLAKKYQYVIDIHEASHGINNFIIIPKKRLPKSFRVSLINVGTVLLWPDPKGPLSQVIENAVELEFGMRNKERAKIIKAAENSIVWFIKNIYQRDKKKKIRQKLYYVYGKLMKKEVSEGTDKLKDFRRVKMNKEIFYPLLVGQYLQDGIVCYKMRPIKSE